MILFSEFSERHRCQSSAKNLHELGWSTIMSQYTDIEQYYKQCKQLPKIFTVHDPLRLDQVLILKCYLLTVSNFHVDLVRTIFWEPNHGKVIDSRIFRSQIRFGRLHARKLVLTGLNAWLIFENWVLALLGISLCWRLLKMGMLLSIRRILSNTLLLHSITSLLKFPFACALCISFQPEIRTTTHCLACTVIPSYKYGLASNCEASFWCLTSTKWAASWNESSP